EDAQVMLDNGTKTWGLLIGDHYSQQEAEELRARLLDAAIETTIVSLSPSAPVAKNADTIAPTGNRSNVRLAAARPTGPVREVVAFAAGSSRLFSSSAPIM